VAERSEQIELFYLPSYSPELNRPGFRGGQLV
jgi:hypothetical protein